MLSMEKILLEENVEALRMAMGNWVHKQLILMTAAQFTAKGQKIDGNAFIKVSDTIKKSASLFSPLKSIHFPITGMILASEKIPDDEVNRLHRNYELLRKVGLRSSVFTYMAAYLMEDSMDTERIKAVFEEMKKHHRFLTSYDDYPAAVIIAKQEGDVESLLEVSEQYYQMLNENGFYKGNDLQFLANMLVMNGAFNKKLASNVIYAKDELNRNGLKVKQIHYPSIGVISLSGKINEAVTCSLELKDMKLFKWYKDMAIVAATYFVSQQYVDASSSITVAMQAIIQAQQAASAAAISAAAAASASN